MQLCICCCALRGGSSPPLQMVSRTLQFDTFSITSYNLYLPWYQVLFTRVANICKSIGWYASSQIVPGLPHVGFCLRELNSCYPKSEIAFTFSVPERERRNLRTKFILKQGLVGWGGFGDNSPSSTKEEMRASSTSIPTHAEEMAPARFSFWPNEVWLAQNPFRLWLELVIESNSLGSVSGEVAAVEPMRWRLGPSFFFFLLSVWMCKYRPYTYQFLDREVLEYAKGTITRSHNHNEPTWISSYCTVPFLYQPPTTGTGSDHNGENLTCGSVFPAELLTYLELKPGQDMQYRNATLGPFHQSSRMSLSDNGRIRPNMLPSSPEQLPEEHPFNPPPLPSDPMS